MEESFLHFMVTCVILYLLGYVDLLLKRVATKIFHELWRKDMFSMFYKPLGSISDFQSIEQLLHYSRQVEIPATVLPRKRYCKLPNGDILFTANPRFTYLTLPWLGIEDFLQENGFTEIHKRQLPKVDYSAISKNFEELMLKQMMLQYWAAAFQKCGEKAKSKNIASVSIQQEVGFHDITFQDCTLKVETPKSFGLSSEVTCKGMVTAYPQCEGLCNVGTFIYFNTFLMICDEYGRTFLLQQVSDQKPLIPIVTQLVEANYTINPTPEKYVTF